MKELLKKQSARFWIAAVFLGVILLMALVPQLFTHYDPIGQNMNELLQKPSTLHWFGTDNLGRDVFSRVVYSARLDLEIGI